MKKKNSDNFFWKIFLSEIFLIILIGSLCIGMHVGNLRTEASSLTIENTDVMENVYIEMPDGEQVPWNQSPYSKIVINIPQKKNVFAEKEQSGRIKHAAKKTVVKSSEIEQLIVQLAEESEFDNIHLLKKIIMCESGWKPKVINWSSYDYGLWQINLRYNPEVTKACALNPECSTRWAINEIQSGNLWKWKASRYCWAGAI